MESVRGQIKRILVDGRKNSSRSLMLIGYETDDGGPLITAKLSGRTGEFKEGDYFIAEGDWKMGTYRGLEDPVFHASSIVPEFPSALMPSADYLKQMFNERDHGLSPAAINALVQRLGKDSIKQIFDDVTLLTSASSDPDTYAETIRDDFARRTGGWKATRLLQQADFKPDVINRILAQLKGEAYAILTKDPYEVLRASSVSFDEADKFARSMGVAGSDYRRLSAAMYNYLRVNTTSGSTCLPLKEAIVDIAASVGVDMKTFSAFLVDTIRTRSASRFVVTIAPRTGELIAALSRHYLAEVTAAENIARLIESGKVYNKKRVEQLVASVMKSPEFEKFTPDEYQNAAVVNSVTYPISIITGGPGTGKSTILAAVLKTVEAYGDVSQVFVSAPTGKAATRAQETTGKPATTLHLLLGMGEDPVTGGPSWRRNKNNPLPSGILVVVDEVSMMDAELLAALVDAMPSDGRLILMGDKHQLPSVGAGKVLADLMAANIDGVAIIAVSHLVNVYRQDKNSKIAQDAKLIHQGVEPHIDSIARGGVSYIETQSHQITSMIETLYKTTLRQIDNLDLVNDVAVIAPQAPGHGGTWEVNTRLSRLLNPDGEALPFANKIASDPPDMPIPRVGDKVMLTERNDMQNKVMNGDIGRIVSARTEGKRGFFTVHFENDKTVEYPANRWRNFILAYAITTHKSQGSQYPVVILPWSRGHLRMAERTLLYTGWTRAKDLVIGVGDRHFFREAIRTHKLNDRATNLPALLEDIMTRRQLKPMGFPLPPPEEPVAANDRIPSAAAPEPAPARAPRPMPAPRPIAGPVARPVLPALATRPSPSAVTSPVARPVTSRLPLPAIKVPTTTVSKAPAASTKPQDATPVRGPEGSSHAVRQGQIIYGAPAARNHPAAGAVPLPRLLKAPANDIQPRRVPAPAQAAPPPPAPGTSDSITYSAPATTKAPVVAASRLRPIIGGRIKARPEELSTEATPPEPPLKGPGL